MSRATPGPRRPTSAGVAPPEMTRRRRKRARVDPQLQGIVDLPLWDSFLCSMCGEVRSRLYLVLESRTVDVCDYCGR